MLISFRRWRLPTTPDGGGSSEGNGDGDAANDVFNWFSCCTSPAARCTRHTLHSTAPLPHQQCTLTAASLVARQPPAAARQLEPLLGPLGNVATCNWQLPSPFADDGRRATGNEQRAFFFATLALAINCEGSMQLIWFAIVSKAAAILQPPPALVCLSLSFFPPFSLALLASFSVAPFTVSPQMLVAQKKFGYLMQILCAGQIVQLLFAMLSLSLCTTFWDSLCLNHLGILNEFWIAFSATCLG